MKSYEILSKILRRTAAHVGPGITTLELNNIAAMYMREYGAWSYNKNFKEKFSKTPFPHETCISVNYEIAHGIPGLYILKEGDIVNIDMGIVKDGECADAALMVPVGKIDNKHARLLQYTRKALLRAIEVVKDGVTVQEIAKRIDETASWAGLVVNRQLTGHAIGKDMHEEPFIYQTQNWITQDQRQYHEVQGYLDIKLKAGMKICIEPMITFKDRYGKLSSNGWTFVTKDRQYSAMYEHMVEVTKEGCNVLTTHID